VTTSLRIALTKRFQNPGRRVAGGRLGIMAIMSRPRRGLPKAARHSNSTSWFAQANSSQRSQFILCHRPRKQLEFYSTRLPRSLIPSSTYHHPHVTSPCLGARGEGFIGGAGKGVSQASGAVKSNWSVSESVERPIRNKGDSSHCSASIRDPDFAQGRQTDTSHILCPLISWNRS
jgi:hypothetical protein